MMTKNTERGFSLMEVIIGVALLMIIGIGATTALNQYMKHSSRITMYGQQDTAFRSFAGEFNSLLKNSNVAPHFQRFPIPVSGCSLNGPCVQKLNIASQAFEAASTTDFGGATAIEFFSDYNANLFEQPAFGNGVDVKIKYRKRLDLRSIKSDKAYDYYTTWTLIDPNSKPFIVLSKSNAAGYLSFPDAYATASPNGAIERWTIFKGYGNINISDFKKSFLAFYNGYNARQYWIQKIDDMISCSANLTFCKKVSVTLNPSQSTTSLSNGYYAVKTSAITETLLGSTFLPSITTYGQWWSQSAAAYLFPSSIGSFFMVQNSDFASPFDVRKVTHFFHSQTVRSQFLAIPVNLNSYGLKTVKGKNRLVLRTIPQISAKQETTVMNDIPLDSKVVFARKIGTNQISVILYKN